MHTVTMTVGAQNLLTANQRLHHMRRPAIVKLPRRAAAAAAAPQTAPRLDRAHITVHAAWPDRRRRDVHNLYVTVKACIDGLIDYGLLPDDDDRHLTGPDLRVDPDLSGIPKSTRLTFHIKETP
ncbi:hypothetical protein [Sanguibacter massiliensis]|uniref:hypothetical protein n=1 Tax=Sanguibacter massiliensis TaxID=1973217 RepID=UPI0013EBFA95|nr:hypothetical protein [Sanguibacter massiliensis]